MKPNRQKVAERLDLDGWEVASIIDPDLLDWWVDEMWKVKSVWSPKGAVVYISFLVDPQHEGTRKKGQSIWGIGCSKKFPTNSLEAQSCSSIGFGKTFKKEIFNFQTDMETLRESY